MREDNPMRWSFLEEESDACCVVTRRMELVYLTGRHGLLRLARVHLSGPFHLSTVSNAAKPIESKLLILSVLSGSNGTADGCEEACFAQISMIRCQFDGLSPGPCL